MPNNKQNIGKMELVEAITTLHKSKLPPTHQRGQEPIDGIFLSSLLRYLAYDDGIGSNHQGIWLNNPAIMLFGDNLQHHTPAKARRLQCKDPQTIQKYNDELYNNLQGQLIFQRVNTLQASATNRLMAPQQWKYKELD